MSSDVNSSSINNTTSLEIENNFSRSDCIECKHVFSSMSKNKSEHDLCGSTKNPGSSKITENEHSELNVLLETLKTAKKTNDQSIQQSFGILEKHKNESADISKQAYNYFRELHNVLHCLEKDIQCDIKTKREILLNKTKTVLDLLKTGREQINGKISELRCYIHCNVSNMKTIAQITEETDTFLNNVNCTVKFDGKERELFTTLFNSLDTPINAIKSFKMDFNDDFYHPKVGPYQSNVRKTYELKNIAINSRDTTNSNNVKKRSVFPKKISYVSFIESPSHFYIRTEAFVNSFHSLKAKCRDEGNKSHSPENIELGEIYLIKELKVKENNEKDEYRRGRLDFKKSDLLYHVFYIDYGNYEDVSTDRIRKIISSELAEKTENIILCSLYDIEPVKDKWEDKATYHMKDIVDSGSNIFVVFLGHCDKKQIVDLIKSDKCNFSVRDSLIFAGYAKKLEDSFTSKAINEYQNRKNCIYKSSIDNDKICSKHFEMNSLFGVKMRHIVNPSEFYVTKSSLIEQINANNDNLNSAYNIHYTPLYFPQINQNCAARSNELKCWVRGRIQKVQTNQKCIVFFIDFGLTEELRWDELAVLDDVFCKASNGVIKCSLLDVVPLQKNFYKWTEDAIKDFRRYTSSNNLTICIGAFYNGTYTTTLFSNKRDRHICINAKLVDSNHCMSSGPESTRIEWINNIQDYHYEDDTNLNKLEEFETDKSKLGCDVVKILNIISPEKFYVSLSKHLTKLEKLHEEIQLKMFDCEPIEKNCDWTLNESCFVLTNQNIIKSDEKWYRGKVTDISDENIKVFLRDKGISLKVSKSKLAKITEENKILDEEIIDGAVECHLACLRPPGGSHSKWSSSATDAFKDIVESFDEISIQKYEIGSQNKSCSVLLFGLTYVTKALSTQIKLNNVNQLLASIGLCSIVVKIPVNNLNEKNSFENIQNTQNNDISTVTYDFSDYNHQIDKWPSANNINKQSFIGKVFYVDNNAGIYIRDNDIESVSKEVNNRLNFKFMNSKTSVNDINWKVGQPCICKYHLDRKFYRAEIVQIENDMCKVRFIDYGNIEQVKISELRSEIICGNIPMLINRYIIADMIPIDKNCKWSRSALDRIHALLVGKVTDVVTIENDINKCNITVNGVGVVELLIAEGLVRRGDTSMIKKHDDLYDFNNQSILDDKSFAETNTTVQSKTPETNNDFLVGIPKINYEEYEKFFIGKTSESEDFKTTNEQLEEEENKQFLNFYLAHTVNTSIDSADFLPKNTSSRKGSTAVTAEKKETLSELKLTEKNFYCNIIAIKSVDTISIYPKIDSHVTLMSEMDSSIQEFGNFADVVDDKLVAIGRIYLVKYKNDGKWYRAKVVNINYDEEEADILYIDYLNTECVKLDEIRECPRNFISYNLMNISVGLHGVEYNPNIEQISVYNKLAELFEGKTMYAKVIENCNGRLPKVDLYEKKNSRSVIYQNLIDNELLLVSS